MNLPECPLCGSKAMKFQDGIHACCSSTPCPLNCTCPDMTIEQWKALDTKTLQDQNKALREVATESITVLEALNVGQTSIAERSMKKLVENMNKALGKE